MVSGIHLWFALAGLYLIESFRLLPPGVMLFRRRLRDGAWQARKPIGGADGSRAWTLLPMLPGSDADLIAQDIAYACDSSLLTPAALTGVSRDDRQVLLNGKKFIDCTSAANAEFLAGFLSRLRDTPEEARGDAVARAFHASLQPGLRPALEAFRERTVAVRTLSGVLWMLLFPVLLGALLITGNDAVLIPAAILTWTLALAIAIATGLARRRLAPPGQRRFPWASFKYIVYPVAALRAQDDMAANLFPGVHPVAFCLDLTSGENRADTLRTVLLEALYPLPGDDDASEGATWFTGLLAQQIKDTLAEHAPDVLRSVIPKRSGDSSQAWCPRCLAQYRIASGDCSDCPGISLQPFASERPARKGKRK